ncbi:MAG TPA: hypothetical protein VG755_25745, partial [Nannocystaceae bacterium]|nr:hypothetical protein [Nannocystaceae bacterium]
DGGDAGEGGDDGVDDGGSDEGDVPMPALPQGYGLDDGAQGCGCASGRAWPGGAVLVVLAAVRRRRRAAGS